MNNNEEIEMVHDYLVGAGYESVDEWMLDSDYIYTAGEWCQVDNPTIAVNAWETLVNAIYSSLEA